MSTTTGRKVRADAKLEQLNEAQRERLRGWLEEKSYDSVVKLVREEFGLSVGRSAVSVYYRRHGYHRRGCGHDEIRRNSCSQSRKGREIRPINRVPTTANSRSG